MKRASLKGDSIISAIEKYFTVNQKYPESLSQLVPEYLDKIPSTGMCAYPDFDYSLSKRENPEDDPYQLNINTPSGGINFDEFRYFPSGKYGESHHRIGKWAYYHE